MIPRLLMPLAAVAFGLRLLGRLVVRTAVQHVRDAEQRRSGG